MRRGLPQVVLLLREVGLLLRLLQAGWLVVGPLGVLWVVVLVVLVVVVVAGPYWLWPVRVLTSGELSVLP